MKDARALIHAHTEISSPFLCPEIKLHLITPQCPLWRMSPVGAAEKGIQDPFWGFCWAGGQVLGRYVLDHASIFEGKRILDFGAGSGVEAIAAMKVGAANVLAVDIDALATEAIKMNAELNHVVVDVETRDVIGETGDWEIVLAGDMFYEPELSRAVFSWLEKLTQRGVLVLLGDPDRGFLPKNKLQALAYYEAPSDVDTGGRYLRQATVYSLSPDPGSFRQTAQPHPLR